MFVFGFGVHVAVVLPPLGVTVARRCRRAAWAVVVAANGRAGGGRRDARARVGNTVRKVPRLERSTVPRSRPRGAVPVGSGLRLLSRPRLRSSRWRC
jgi:hypothetical protein